MENPGSPWNAALDAAGRVGSLMRGIDLPCAGSRRVVEVLALWITVGYKGGSQRWARSQEVVETGAFARSLSHSMASAPGVRRIS